LESHKHGFVEKVPAKEAKIDDIQHGENPEKKDPHSIRKYEQVPHK
jgi:hypothetical protein